MGVWREEDHPRGEDGRFIDKINAFVSKGGMVPLLTNGSFDLFNFQKQYEKLCSSKNLETPNAGEKAIPYSERGIEIDSRLQDFKETKKERRLYCR